MTPLGLIAELTHRCPLRCAYCSNPVELAAKSSELSTADWLRVIEEAGDLGVKQIYFTGGEPCLRPDLVELVAAARARGLYVNLITSGVGFTEALCKALVQAGVDHIQLSLQDSDRDGAKQVSGVNALDKKFAAANLIRHLPVAFTVNVVVHRNNLARLPRLIETAVAMDASKVEIAHVQFNGWALKNRAWLLPSREQVSESVRLIHQARETYKNKVRFDYVLPDYYAKSPKACMNGWGRALMLIDPQGRVLPCHSAASLPGVQLPSVREAGLRAIWNESALFNLFRGDEWMPKECRACPQKEKDFGGCRCQALALTGDAKNSDPVCQMSPHRSAVDHAIAEASAAEPVHRPVFV